MTKVKASDVPTLREALEAIADGEGDAVVIAQQTLDANPVAATRLEALQAQPVGESDLGDPADWQSKLDELHGWSGSAWIAGEDDDASDSERKSQCYSFLCSLIGYLMAGRDAAALTASPPVVEREAIARIIDPEAFSSVGNTHLKETLGRGPRDRKAALTKADAILALTAVEGVGEREDERKAMRDYMLACAAEADRQRLNLVSSGHKLAARNCEAEATAYRNAARMIDCEDHASYRSTPVAQGDEVRDALERIDKFVTDYLSPWGSWKTPWWEGEVSDEATFSDDNALKHCANIARSARATLTKGARDAG